jgi:stage II sporulation protein D
VHLVHDNVTQELSLEDYVLGVMRAEGTMETEPEALKALAIAIRTFAVKNRGRHAKDGYDFCSTTHCQRFIVSGPTVREGPIGAGADTKLLDAVHATEGQILLDDHGAVVDSYFGASCGGETANIGELWGVTPPTYLRGVRDEYCVAGPHANWSDVITRANLLRALQSDPRTDVGDRLDHIVISRRDETGRAEFITLEGEHRKTVRGWDLKIIVGRVLGWNVLKSSRFDVARAGANFIFRGSGFGHGLGLCQEGAHVMAARGMGYQKILEKYFPRTVVKRDTESGRRGDAVNAGELRWKSDVLGSAAQHGSLIPGLRVSASSTLRFLVIASEHFRVTYPSDVDRRDADQVLNTLESARNDFIRRASGASIAANVPLLEIRLNQSTGDFTARTGQPWWAAAATKGNRIELQPLPLLKKRGVLFTTLRHELAHVIIDLVGRNRAPRWLEEGFSIYLAGEGHLFAHYTRTAIGGDELERRLDHPRTQSEMRELYAQAYRTVSELVRQQGEASVWKKLAAG